MVCQELEEKIGGIKLDCDLCLQIQTVGEAYENIGEVEPLEVTTGFTSILDQISSEEMAYHQQMDNQIGPVLRSVQEQIPPTKSILYKI